MKHLRDKAVLITGASSGIGRATAIRLAGLGCHLALAARNREALSEVREQVEAAGAKGFVIPTDVTDSVQVHRAVEQAAAAFGKLDILVCSAGLSMRAYFENSSLEAMERVMKVNFFGTMYATFHAIPHIKKSKGSLVAISSLTGKRGIPSYAVYGASKFAIQGLYEALDIELGRDGVHVGVVSPAFVDTPLRTNVLGPDGKPWGTPPPPPFRIWPVEKAVAAVVNLIAKRKKEALLPWFTGPMLIIDRMFGRRLGNRILAKRFPPDAPSPPNDTAERDDR
jgi:NAD(P)-dependent dehydrogenase (short-subunit alcohol dehydrogenase family)